MKRAAQILDEILPANSSTRQVVTTIQNTSGDSCETQPKGGVDMVDWFFLRLSTIYGAKFRSQFTCNAEIQLAKLEWRRQIEAHTKNRLHRKLEIAKSNMSLRDYQWPNIAVILKTPLDSPDGSNALAYQVTNALPSPPRDKVRDAERIKRIRELMN